MRARFWLKLLPGLLLAALMAGTALAGGVVITLDQDLSGVTPDKPFDVNFTIRSMHDKSYQDGFTPIITAVNAETGAELTFDAVAGEGPGQYRATLTLPAGTWNWTIRPDGYYPDSLMATMTPIEVSAASAAVAAPAASPVINLTWLWVALPLAGLALLAVAWARRPRRISVTA
jgi:hypothetical protein